MKHYKYCPICGCVIVRRTVDGRSRGVCPLCDWIDYKNPIPAVACLVSRNKKELLLIRRAVPPYKGEWCIPGGFIEMGETLPEAGARELKEETGLNGRSGRLIGAHMQKSGIYGSVLVVGMEFLVKKYDATAGDDALEAAFIPLKHLPGIPFETHRKLITSYLRSIM